MNSVTFHGEAFSEYFCTKLLWTDPQLGSELDPQAAEQLYKKASSNIRFAQRQLRDREQARSTSSLLLTPLAELLGWRLGESAKVVTELEQEEDAGAPLLDGEDRKLARAVCIAPDAHLDAAPAGMHRRFAPTQSLARVLREEGASYGLLLNAFELRLVCTTGTLPSHIGFDLTSIAEGTEPGLQAWKLMHALLKQPALSAEPPLLDRVRKIGAEHQLSVSTTLGRQVQQTVVRFMQGVLDHPDNKSKLPATITDTFLHDLYQETLRYLYRLLFILYAEDLNLLPMDMLTYREGYSLNRLIRLARESGNDSLEETDPNGRFFQHSLDALFELLRRGCHLGPEGEIKPYGGGLFDADGTRLLSQFALGNAMLDQAIEQLTMIPAPKGQVGRVRLSYRELNVEQLGSIYEGLLEQTPAYAHQRMWRCELDSRLIVINDPDRERIRTVREERASDVLEMEGEPDDETLPDEEDSEATDDESSDEESADEGATKRPKQSAKKPLKVLAEIPAGAVFLKGSQARKQSGSYYTNRAFVDFLVREALDPMADGKPSAEILSLKVLDPAMGSAHFLVGATRRLAEHLLSAYRREAARIQAEPGHADLSEDDVLTLANVPEELLRVWGSVDEERELAVCRLLVAGNCIYGVDRNPLAVDLAKVSLWLVTAASRMPLSFLDHRLQCGDSLLGIPADEVVRPWIRPAKGSKTAKETLIKPVELLMSPRHGQEVFEYEAPSRALLCSSFSRAFTCLGQLVASIETEPSNFALHRSRHGVLRATLQPWWEIHELRVGMAFQETAPSPELLNTWLEDVLHQSRIRDDHRAQAESIRARGAELKAFCWELAFPEVFYQPDGQRRPDAGFSCVLGNPPWDKIKPERDGFYLAYDPLIRQLQGTAKNRRIEELHRDNPAIAEAWHDYESRTKALTDALLATGIYAHQTAVVEEEVEGEDGETVIKAKTTGGDPDCFKFFLERAWQLAAPGRAVGMVMSYGLHQSMGCTGLRRLLLDECELRLLVKFDNEMRVFPGVHNQFKFDLVVFTKGNRTTFFDAAFFHREEAKALEMLRQHPVHLRLHANDIQNMSPQTRTFSEFRGKLDLALVHKAFDLHGPFGTTVYRPLGMTYRTEVHMTNGKWCFRSRDWLRQHGCVRESGEQWRAADPEWYEQRKYLKRPVAEWYVLFEGEKAKAYRLPWDVKSAKAVKESDLHDFPLRFQLPNGMRLVAQGIEGENACVYAPQNSVRDSDLPAHIFGLDELKSFTFAPVLMPGSRFVPLIEGKSIFQFSYRRFAYVSGGGSWVVTRTADHSETDLIPQLFTLEEDSTAIRRTQTAHVGFRAISRSADERTGVAAIIPPPLVSGNSVGLLTGTGISVAQMRFVVAIINSLPFDFLLRMCAAANVNLNTLQRVPCPSFEDGVGAKIERLTQHLLTSDVFAEFGAPKVTTLKSDLAVADVRALLDACCAELFELTPHEYAYILTTFPLLDRDQPPLPHDYRIRATNKGVEWRKISFITRDLALLTYCDYLAGRLDVQPDLDRVRRICPNGVPEPPTNLIEFFAAAGVDISGQTEHAVAATGPLLNLRDRVTRARELGAIAYIPTIDRRRATFVERAATAGGLTPEEGVLTPEMSQHVLREKATRDAKWARAMELWEATPDPRKDSTMS